MSKKLSIIRFKPKPEHYDDFLKDVIENGKEREPEPIPVDQVKEEISELIKSEKRDEKLKQYIEELREVANIIDEESPSPTS